MKLGDVLKKEREFAQVSIEVAAEKLGISVTEYQELENGNSPAEKWGPILAQIAVSLEVPMSRLLAESGRFSDTNQTNGQCGSIIKGQREMKEKTIENVTEGVKQNMNSYLIWQDYDFDQDDYEDVENGNSPIEKYGPLLLGFAELIGKPIFELIYPMGLPYSEMDVSEFPY